MNILKNIPQLAKLIFNNSSAKKQFVYTAIGDSAAEGIGASTHDRSYTGILHMYLKKRHSEVVYHNFAKKGSPVDDVLKHQLQKTISTNPNLITISVGANDLRLRTTPSTFEKRLDHLIKELKKNTTAKIIINTIPDFSHTPFIPKFLGRISHYAVKHYNTKISKVATSNNILLVDLFDQGEYYIKHFPEAISDDGFHPSDIGYAIWANTILVTLKGLKSFN